MIQSLTDPMKTPSKASRFSLIASQKKMGRKLIVRVVKKLGQVDSYPKNQPRPSKKEGLEPEWKGAHGISSFHQFSDPMI